MNKLFNIYCDESCHLEPSSNTLKTQFMVIGGVACFEKKKDEAFKKIKEMKRKENFSSSFEVKWTKISKSKLKFYENFINYFFDCDFLSFRAIIIDKNQLNHKKFSQTHDDFYYKMYWQMLNWFIEQPYHSGEGQHTYHTYLDIKDTLGQKKITKLHEILSKPHKNINLMKKIQEVRSHEIAIMQITDLLVGAVAYANRYPSGGKNEAKNSIVSLIQQLSKKQLRYSSSFPENKFNLFKWKGKK